MNLEMIYATQNAAIDAIRSIRISEDLNEVATAIRAHRRVVVTGVGKSFCIALRTASMFRASGIPAHAIHAADAGHGDLGALLGESLLPLIVFSASGESRECVTLLMSEPASRCHRVAVTTRPDSTVGILCDWRLCYGPVYESGSSGLLPQASTIAAATLADCLVVATCGELGAGHFAKLHPLGQIGQSSRDMEGCE